MKSEKYWKSRAANRMFSYHQKADKVADDIAGAYIKATEQINQEVKTIFRTFQIDGGLSEEEAKKLLNELPDDAKLKSLKEIVHQVKDPKQRQALLSQINSPAYAYRIKRFEQLQNDIDKQTAQLASFEQTATRVHYVDLADEAYHRVIFDIQQGTGIGFSFSRMPVSRIEAILSQNWSGELFSERIWGRVDNLNKSIQQELLAQFMTGRSYQKTAKEIEDRLAVSSMAARRLVRTESTYIANEAELESYRECGIDKFQFVATLDMRTSDLCQQMDGKEFAVKDASPGTNIPPLHPWCRSTTIAVIDGAITDNLKRNARDPKTGKNYKVPADTTYQEWKKEVDDKYEKGTWESERKKLINKPVDKVQYQQYIQVLGKKNMPKTFDLFQEMKYNSNEEWSDLKYYYRNINGRPIEYVKIDRELEKFGIKDKGRAYPIEDIAITGWRSHAKKRLLKRGVTEAQALLYKDTAIGMMKKYPHPNTQNNYFSEEGVLGVRASDGIICTVYTKDDFGNETKKILEVFKKWLK